MQLEDVWGIGPKTAAILESTVGAERALEAVASGDVRTLVEAGVPAGRATRIVRRASDGEDLSLLATPDARRTYRALLERIGPFAVNRRAGDRVQLLTPSRDRATIEDRQRAAERARDSWRALDDDGRRTVLEALARRDDAPGDGAIEVALALRRQAPDGPLFEPILALPIDALERGAAAIATAEAPDSDDRLAGLNAATAAVDDLRADVSALLESIRGSDVRASEDFREAYVEAVTDRLDGDVEASTIRSATPEAAADARDFVTDALRQLSAALRAEAEAREERLLERAATAMGETAGTLDRARAAVDDVGFRLTLARFAEAYDLVRPRIVGDGATIAFRGARNLALVDEKSTAVRPVTYALGEPRGPGWEGVPTGDRVAVLTGANSGGKTTLLETCCEVALLAHLGLPVPAEAATVAVLDAVVFHRRHASFNAGVLESTLRTVLPPLTADGRTLMLVDEFEAITEPGKAADLLDGLVRLTVDEGAVGVFVTHLAGELEPLPSSARIDGIAAEGLGADGELIVDYQPRFGELGRSTPELLVARLVDRAEDPAERAGYAALARAVGAAVRQRTLTDDRWRT